MCLMAHKLFYAFCFNFVQMHFVCCIDLFVQLDILFLYVRFGAPLWQSMHWINLETLLLLSLEPFISCMHIDRNVAPVLTFLYDAQIVDSDNCAKWLQCLLLIQHWFHTKNFIYCHFLLLLYYVFYENDFLSHILLDVM